MSREYVLLQQEEGGSWSYVGKVEASSAGGAIRAATSQLGDGVEGTFVAVPERSWDPMRVEVEVATSRKVKIASSRPPRPRKPKAEPVASEPSAQPVGAGDAR